MSNRITQKHIDQHLDTLNVLGQELGLEGAGNWIVANQHSASHGNKSLLFQDPSNYSINTRTALGSHTWDTNREVMAGLTGLISGLYAMKK